MAARREEGCYQQHIRMHTFFLFTVYKGLLADDVAVF